MLNKALLMPPILFKISIGNQSHCSIKLSKNFAMSGELITVTVNPDIGYDNTIVGISTNGTVTKVNNTTFTFIMPNENVIVSASSSLLSFRINVNKQGSGTVNVKSIANYGEIVIISVIPSNGFRLTSISSNNVNLSGNGNSRTFVMPANDVTLNVAFEDLRVVLTCGRVSGESGLPGYDDIDETTGSLNRVPYWETRDKCLTQFFARWDWHTLFNLGTNINSTLECSFKTIYVNGQPFTLGYDGTSQRKYYCDGNNNLGLSDGKVITLTFDPPPTGFL